MAKQLIYIGATWCGPCVALKPFMTGLTGMQGWEIHIYDFDQDAATVADIRSNLFPDSVTLPICIILNDNGNVYAKTDAASENWILEKMEGILNQGTFPNEPNTEWQDSENSLDDLKKYGLLALGILVLIIILLSLLKWKGKI